MAEPELIGQKLGEFVIREWLAKGVYRSEQQSLKRDAVVKVLHAQAHDDSVRIRFLREADIASRFSHPFAAQIYDFGTDTKLGVYWIAMELVRGTTLAEWLRDRGPMSLGQFAPYFRCVAMVVNAMHDAGIVHRDLKPSNLMVVACGQDLLPKLLDFGIAKLRACSSPDKAPDMSPASEADGVPTMNAGIRRQRIQRTNSDPPMAEMPLTQPGVVLGSAPYMSPEQWGAPYAVDVAADIYSLGCVAYEALTGHAPFDATTTRELYDQHLHRDPPRLKDVLPSVERTLRRALAKSPDVRHRTALELADELGAAHRSEPREQLRSAVKQWIDRDRPPGLLWGHDVLDVEYRPALSDHESSFITASRRRARRFQRLERSLGALIAFVALMGIGILEYRSMMNRQLADERARRAEQLTRAEHERAEAKIAESELERGRSALLHGEPEALTHLAEAFKRDPSRMTAFMLAQSITSRLLERARFDATHGRMWWSTFSPDGRQIVTADDRAARIWDAETHALKLTMPHGHEVYQALYSPDGARLVTASETAVKVWNTATGALIHEMTAKSDGRTPSDFYRAAISPDGRLIAAADAAGSVVHVWDADGALVAQLRLRADAFPRLAFSHDGVWLAATGGHEARVFAVRTWKQITEVPGQIHSIEFDARGRLLTGAATGDVALWKIPNSERLLHLRQFGEAVDAVAFSPDGQLLAAGSRDGAIQVWHANGALVSQLNPRRSKVHAIEFDESSKLLLAANADGTVVVADVAQGLPLTTLEGPRNIIRTAHFGPHLQVVAASSDGTARLWDATSPYRRWSADPMGDCGVIMSPEPDERYVAVGCRDRAVRIWDTARDQELAELPSSTSIATGGYTSAFPAVSSDGSRAAISRGNYVQLYELPGGRLMRTIRHGAQVSSVAFASRGLDVVSGAVDGSVFITSEDGAQMALQEPAGIDLAQVLADGRVVVADAERRLRFHSSAGALLADLETPTRIMSFRSDGSHAIALPSYLANAAAPLLIDLERFRVIAQLQGHIGQVFSARWVSGNHVLTAGADGTANLWDGGSGRLLQTYRGSPRFLADATVTPDGLVIAGDANGLLRFWNAATGDLLWALQAHKSAVIGVHVEHGDIVTRGFNGEISRWRIPSSEQVLESCAGNTACGIVTK